MFAALLAFCVLAAILGMVVPQYSPTDPCRGGKSGVCPYELLH